MESSSEDDLESPVEGGALVQGQDVWYVTYSSTEICAVKGSTVEIKCSYTYPSTWRGRVNTIQKTFWFTEQKDGEPVDLTTDSEYAGRVEDLCENNICTLRIRNLRESDSAEYKFRIKTSQASRWGYPVTLSVTDLQVEVSRSGSSTLLQCLSSCPPGHTSYIWFKNGQKVKEDTSPNADFRYDPADSYSCALKGYEDFPSPSVYPPKLPSVSVSPPAEIEEGSSVTLTCSSDANPAANYTWYKTEQNSQLSFVKEGPRLVLSSFQVSDSGRYFCRAENLLGSRRSESISIDVKYAPKPPSVSVSPSAEIEEGSSVTLTCSSDANPAANYTWYKKNGNADLSSVSEGPRIFLSSIQSSDSGQYFCRAENLLGSRRSESIFIDATYAPKLPSVSVSPSAEIEEGSSVTLTCSSDANPAANYTWYKTEQNSQLSFVKEGPRLVLSSFQVSDSGRYFCRAENLLGSRRSESIFIDVKYAPKPPSVSVSPSAEIEEGSSVTLTCSSDANPAANYTWYKEDGNADLSSVSEGPRLFLSSIQSSDSGQYYCRAENLLGSRRSESIFIDATYSPKLPSVSASPSAEIEEGSSVTLTCSSDANPAANYTWYKEDEDSPKASGQIFTITDFRAEHSGSYSCGAQNKLGRSNSTLTLIVVAGSSTTIVNIIRTTLGVLILISVFLLSLWMRKKKALRSTTEAPEPEEIELDSDPEYENVSHTAAQTEDTEEQEDMV
ncbi:B-cell receptor CD22-like [Gymnodraco acuticeps]|uniref:B-cell receptor CD22-like n=1 Tax=Gymnodraco acuticeps TaxID=8218 RepID=A0A6P8TE21_GYMAC|nr:B-cell receptor CD22-like [Gymnodraco acuticeps]